MRCVRAFPLAAVLLAAAVSGAEQPIRGLEFEIRVAATGHPTIHLHARERTTAPLSGDPVRHGAMLTIAVSGNGVDRQTFVLPAQRRKRSGPGWREGRGSAGRGSFIYRDPRHVRGPVSFLRVARTARDMRLDARVDGFGVTLRPPDPGAAAGLVVTLPPGDPYCVGF